MTALLCLLCWRAPPDASPLARALSWGRHRGATFKDKTAARESLAQILAWQPEKIFLAHGRCYENNAMEELRRAFRWLD